MSTERFKSIVQRLVVEAQQDGHLAVVDEILSPEFVDHTPLQGVPPTRDGVKVLFAALQAAFPDLRVTIHDQVAEEDRVVTRKTLAGTHNGAFLGVPATGKQVSMDVIDVLRFSGDQVTDHWAAFDQLSLLVQMGALPASG
ncbi:MAG TPA: ester cyclase [Thermoanaerobaculia bacterium]|nr:ester cyclase [Thermoanaerobaculia bacterium]